MQNNSKKNKVLKKTSSVFTKPANHFALLTDGHSQPFPSFRLGGRGTFGAANSTRGTRFLFGPVASAAAVTATALRLAQIQAQTQLALQQLSALATINTGNRQHRGNRLTTVLSTHLALLNLLSTQPAPVAGVTAVTKGKHHQTMAQYQSNNMYHHHTQPQGVPQNFPNRPGPPHHQQPYQQQGGPATDRLGFQYTPPTQLPDELESALAFRGSRDIDHRFMDQVMGGGGGWMDGPGMARQSSEPESYSSGMVPHTFDNQPGYQQGVDWSSYQQPTKLFAGPPSGPSPQPHHHQGPPPEQQPQNRQRGAGIPGWNTSVSDNPSPQHQGSHSGGGGGVDTQGLYTPESAGSILASFGLSNEDLEVLSHYPDDQLTPDTLPFILRDIQINKSNSQNSTVSSSRGIHDMPLSRSSPLRQGSSHSPEVPSPLNVTQTAGKVIDYGHASQATDDSSTRETLKREQLPSKRTVKMYPSASSSSQAPKHKVDMSPRRRQVRLEPKESERHGDIDYRRLGVHKTKRSPAMEIPPSRARRSDRDYRLDRPKPRPSSQTRHPPSSAVSKPHRGTKRLPTPTMISDFSADPPKVYPHTCSLCHMLCDQAKDWTDHINTVNHTAACRDLRNKYPDWKPNLPRRDPSPVQDVRKPWRSRERSPSRSVSRSLSWSPVPSSTPGRVARRVYRRHPSHEHPQDQHHAGVSAGSSSRFLELPHGESTFSSSKPQRRAGAKAVHKATRPADTKAAASKARDAFAKPPPAKKKKKGVTPSSQSSPHLVYLTGIPMDASEQEVTDLVGSFGKINNVVLMPGSEAQGKQAERLKASVCMVKAEDAQALARSTSLSIRDQQITASLAKKTVAEKTAAAVKGKGGPSKIKSATVAEDQGSEADQKSCDERCAVLINGLPDSGWSESDIIKLAQPFGIPSDIVMAIETGKVLMSMPDQEIAQEMVKVHSFIPVKIQDSELKMCIIKQHISLNTPVALYNLLKRPLDQSSPVGWRSLLVISNVPDTPTAPVEIQRLVQRFGSIQNTLVLNNSMIICEMETDAMALSVFKRFQKFPCIIQNNPMSFSWRPDPKHSKVTTAYLEQHKEAPASATDSQTAAQPTGTAESQHQENGETATEGKEREGNGKNGEEGDEEMGDEKEEGPPQEHEPETKPATPTTPTQNPGEASSLAPTGEDKASSLAATGEDKASSQATTGEDKASSQATTGEDKASSQAATGEDKASSLAPTGEDKASSLAPTGEDKASSQAATGEDKASSLAPTGEDKASSLAPTGEDKASSLATIGEDKASSQGATGEDKASSMATTGEDKASSLATTGEDKASNLAPTGEDKASSQAETKASTSNKPKVTNVLALLEDGRSKTSSGITRAGSAPRGPQKEKRQHTTGPVGEEKKGGKEVKKEVDKRNKEEKERERDAKEQKEATEWRERELKERMRWEREMKEAVKRRMREEEKRDRRKGREGSSGSKSSGRSEGSRRSSRRDGQDRTTTAGEAKKVEEDCFPFDLGDFVTVDEVGDVADFPQASPPHPPVDIDTREEGTNAETRAPGSIPVSEATPTPGQEATPTPGQEATPLQEATPTPGQEATPDQEATTLQEATPTPVQEATTLQEATPTPVQEATPTPGKEATPTPVQEHALVPAPEDMPKGMPTPVTMAMAASETGLAPETSDPPEPQVTCSPGQTPPPDTAAGTATPAPASDSAPESFPPPAPPITLTPPETAPPTTLTPPETAPPTTLTPPERAPAVEAPAPPGGQEEGGAEHQTEGESGKDEAQVRLEKTKEHKEEERRRAPGTVKRQRSEGDRKEEEEEECMKKRQKTESVISEDYRLPPFDPSSPVGMEFLAPKTGFFCKVCERFFNGSSEAQRNHCRSLKHYQNLQKYLESRKTTNKMSG